MILPYHILICAAVLLVAGCSGEITLDNEAMACAHMLGSDAPVRAAEEICTKCTSLYPVKNLDKSCRKSCFINIDFATCASLVDLADKSKVLQW